MHLLVMSSVTILNRVLLLTVLSNIFKDSSGCTVCTWTWGYCLIVSLHASPGYLSMFEFLYLLSNI